MRLKDLLSLGLAPGGATPQRQPLPGMVRNDAGGYGYPVTDSVLFDRFLLLGTESGTFYVNPVALTVDAARATMRVIDADGRAAVDRIVAVSEGGRSARPDSAILALAMATSAEDPATRKAALLALPRVARTGTHLFQFADAVQGLRGWGRSLRRAVAGWYLDQPLDRLAYQAIKYRQRDGWSHRDLLRLAHPVVSADDTGRRALFDAILRGVRDPDLLPADLSQLAAASRLAGVTDPVTTAALIQSHRLPREAVPTELLRQPAVWRALLADMPVTALIRNLAKLSQVGVLTAMDDSVDKVLAVLNDRDHLHRARIHPAALLIAARTYAGGHGLRGRLTWDPVQAVVDALDGAFYQAFANVPATGKRVYLGVDVSASMGQLLPGQSLTAAEAAAATALVVARTESRWVIKGFSGGYYDRQGILRSEMRDLGISPRDRLPTVLAKTRDRTFGATDAALPIVDALRSGLAVDAFVILTDGDTWIGDIHPMQALRDYRARTGIPAKLVQMAFAANRISIADPSDAGTLDIVGFDANAPRLLADFIGGSSTL
jgi:60 kDa SS-A/Ro ribonucleoprotein